MLININLLKAVNLAVSNDETRYYLHGVNIQTTPKGIVLAATDGKRMIVARQKYADGVNAPDGVIREAPALDIIVPRDLIAKIKTTRKSNDYADLLFADGKVTLTLDGVSVSSGVIDGTFPDYRRVIPATTDGALAQFDPSQLITFQKAAALIDGLPVPTLHHNGDAPALVTIKKTDDRDAFEIFGVLMPCRVPTDKPHVAWATVQHNTPSIAA